MTELRDPREDFKDELRVQIKRALRLACKHRMALQIYRLMDVLPEDVWLEMLEFIAANIPAGVAARFAIAERAFYEQCAHCEHERQFHDTQMRSCGVCADFCIYSPAYLLKHDD